MAKEQEEPATNQENTSREERCLRSEPWRNAYVRWKGKIASRVRGHAKKGSSKSKYWDHFSWFVIHGGFENELEAVLLRTLPFFVRSLNRQTGSLGEKRIRAGDDKPELIPLPKLGHKKKRKKK